MKTLLFGLGLLVCSVTAAEARNSASADRAPSNRASAADTQSSVALPEYEFGDHTISVLTVSESDIQMSWSLDVDGVFYTLQVRNGAAALLNAQGTLVAGWRAMDGGLSIFDSEGIVDTDGDIQDIADEFGTLVAVLLDINFIEQLVADTFGQDRWWPVVVGVAFVLSCIDFEYSSTTTYDENGNETGSSSTTTIGWDCDMPDLSNSGGSDTSSSTGAVRARR